jgi:ApbE superfamily uncharacterized protein (UPF0280 family)
MKVEKKKSPLSYTKRKYRSKLDLSGFTSSVVQVAETDLHILAASDISDQATELVIRYRAQLENYISTQPGFLTSLTPLPLDPLAVPIIRQLLSAAKSAGVGPMAAVAGAIAENVGRDLLAQGHAELSVENGGDIFLQRSKECMIAIFAGSSPLSNRIGIKISPEMMPLGICTSSGTVGHSLSFGRADSVTVLASSTALADAAATRLGNEIQKAGDLDYALSVAKVIPGISGVVIVLDDKLGAWGDIALQKL